MTHRRLFIGAKTIAAALFISAAFVPSLANADTALEALSDERKEELRYLLEQDCGSCHGLTRKGGLGSPLMPENVADTSDETLFEVIMNGIPGTPMPPWKYLLSEDDAHWLIKLIRKGKQNEG